MVGLADTMLYSSKWQLKILSLLALLNKKKATTTQITPLFLIIWMYY